MAEDLKGWAGASALWTFLTVLIVLLSLAAVYYFLRSV